MTEPPESRHATAGGRTAAATAVLFATARGDMGVAGALEWDPGVTLLRRFVAQLHELGAREVHVVVRPGDEDVAAGLDVAVHRSPDPAADLRLVSEIARAGTDTLVISGAEVVTQREALAGLLADPRVVTGILGTTGKIAKPFGARVKSRRGRIISAGSTFHNTAAPLHTFLGVLKVGAIDRPRLALVAERLAELRADPPEAWTYELETAKAGTWKLAIARMTRMAEAREERRRLAEAMMEDPEKYAELEGDELDDEERAEQEELEAQAIEREDPALVELLPGDAARLGRRLEAARQDVVGLLLTGLVRDGAQVGMSYLRSLFWARPLSREAADVARERIELHDEEAELLRSAVKASDGFFTTVFVSPISKYIARWTARRGFTPNQITVFALLLGIAAGACFATGHRAGLIAGGVLSYLAFLFDCVDGQNARYTRTFSKLGAWLDSVFDRAKEYVVFAGLAIGSHHVGVDVWTLACAALTLQTARHAVDFAHPTIHHQVIGSVVHAPLEQPGDGFGVNTPLWLRPPPLPREERPLPEPVPLGRRVYRLWRRIGRRRKVVWIKKALVFPIGERFAVLAIVSATTTARTTFIVMLAWGGFAFAYILLGRLMRVLRSETATAPAGTLAGKLGTYRDDGPIARLVGLTLPVWPVLTVVVAGLPVLIAMIVKGDGASDGLAAAVTLWLVVFGSLSAQPVLTDRLRWLVPPLLRVFEYGTITWLATLAGATPAAYAFLAATCFRVYDLVYRLRHHGTEPPRIVADLGLGWDGRVLLVLVLLLLDALPAGLYVAAGLLAFLYVGDAVRAWTTLTRRLVPEFADDDEEEEID
ncbi:MAG: hypothetical protein QOF76_3436 [Solirubrobacteraceae bacterium]|nr:hypothetical protein [Solirubrobacteraceae bacterium]